MPVDEQLASYDEMDLFVLTLYEDVTYDPEADNFFPVVFIASEESCDLDAICLGGSQCCKRLETWLKEFYGVTTFCASDVKITELLNSVAVRCPDWKDRAQQYLGRIKTEAINKANGVKHE